MPKAGGAMEFGIMDVAGVVIMGGTMEWLLTILAGAVGSGCGSRTGCVWGRITRVVFASINQCSESDEINNAAAKDGLVILGNEERLANQG